MKMPENMTRWLPFAAKEQGIGAIPCVCNGVPSWADIMAVFTTVIDATMCAIIAQFIRDLPTSLTMQAISPV